MNFFKLGLTLSTFLISSGCVQLADEKANQETEDIEKGRYLVEIMGCNDCHTTGADDISGGRPPEADWLTGSTLGFTGSYGTVYPTNLRLLINSISAEEWLTLARRMRSNSPMAWTKLPSLTQQDLKAIYDFVRYLGPKGKPAPENLPPGVMPTTEFLPFPLPH